MVTQIKNECVTVTHDCVTCEKQEVLIMASVVNKDIPLEFQMFGELFNLRKEYYIPEDNDEYWEKVIAAFENLHERFPTEYCRDLVIATVNDLDRRYKEMRVAEKRRAQ